MDCLAEVISASVSPWIGGFDFGAAAAGRLGTFEAVAIIACTGKWIDMAVALPATLFSHTDILAVLATGPLVGST